VSGIFLAIAARGGIAPKTVVSHLSDPLTLSLSLREREHSTQRRAYKVPSPAGRGTG